MTDPKNEYMFNVILSIMLGIFIVLVFDTFFTSPRIVYLDNVDA